MSDESGVGDQFREVTNQSWLSRVMGSIVGVPIGILLIIGAIVGIYWNEGRSVTTARSLAEGQSLVVHVDASAISPANEGKLVHLSGDAAASAPLVDPQYQVKAIGLKLVRAAQMYQWQQTEHTETRTKLGGGEEKVTTYNYTRVWSAERFDSTKFRQPAGHENPAAGPEKRHIIARDAKLGAFKLPPELIADLGDGAPFPIETANMAVASGGPARARVVDGGIYVGADPAQPRVGDQRISYSLVANGPVSAIAKQSGQGLAPYQTRAGDELFMLKGGTLEASKMFKEAASENALLTWILRAVALLVMFFGFTLVMGPLSVIASVIPFLQGVVGAGTGLVAFIATLFVGPLVIAIAWFAVRPIMSIALIVGGGGLAWLAHRFLAGRKGGSVPPQSGMAGSPAAAPAAAPAGWTTAPRQPEVAPPQTQPTSAPAQWGKKGL